MKEQLRYKYKIKRKYFQHSAREVADGAIRDAVMQAFAFNKSFLVYFSYGSEADTHELIKELIAEGKEVYLPRVEGSEIVPVRYSGDQSMLVKNSYGIPEPTGEGYAGDIEVCITPLLAVNSKGYRLGYGGGYYDRYFMRTHGTLKVGVGYYLQLTDEFEEEATDEPLDLFVCERGIINFGKGQ